NPPDLVAHPRDEPEVEAVLEFCEQVGAAAIPYGGGTSVVGGVEPRVGDGYAGAVSIDLGHLDRVLEIDGESRAARIQAGAPGSGAGPSPDRALLGSEGILGLITEAWVRLQDRPTFKTSCGVGFDDFGAGARAVREISQAGLHPANCRLLDALEAETTGASPGPGKALLVLGFESAHHPVDHWMDLALEAARHHGGE